MRGAYHFQGQGEQRSTRQRRTRAPTDSPRTFYRRVTAQERSSVEPSHNKQPVRRTSMDLSFLTGEDSRDDDISHSTVEQGLAKSRSKDGRRGNSETLARGPWDGQSTGPQVSRPSLAHAFARPISTGRLLKRDYATFDTDQQPQQGQGMPPNMQPGPRPGPGQPGQMFMSPAMQNSMLPNGAMGEEQAQQAQQANQQAQDQRQAQRSPALVQQAKTQAQAQAKASQDQASRRAMNIASGVGQESTGSGTTDSNIYPNFKFDPILAPPGMPSQFYPQNISNPRGEPMMRPPNSHPPSPTLTPAQKEAIRNSGSQQTTPAHVSSENAHIQASDELHDRSPGIMDGRTACLGYRSFRGELKYTISEDRTTDAFKRRKVQFMALGQPLNRPAKVEPVTSRGAQITAREQREDGFENIEETRNRSDEFIPSDNNLRQRNIEVYAESLARQHRIVMNDTSTTQDVDSGVSIDDSEHPPRSLYRQQKAGENQLRDRASDRYTSRELSRRADYLREQLSNPALRATGPPGYSHDHRYNLVGHLHRPTDAVPMQRPPYPRYNLQDSAPEFTGQREMRGRDAQDAQYR